MNTVTEPVPASKVIGPTQAENYAVETVSAARESRAMATLTLAFAADPAVRWLLPDPDSYLAGFPLFIRAFGGSAFASGTASGAGQDRAVALWLPPDYGPDEQALIEVVERFAPAPRRAEALELFELMGRFHPASPHWHLPLIGTEPSVQGLGLGSALLTHTLARCDALGLAAYLEATSPRNVPLYRRHGFAALEVLRVGTCPPITPMLRQPQPAGNSCP